MMGFWLTLLFWAAGCSVMDPVNDDDPGVDGVAFVIQLRF